MVSPTAAGPANLPHAKQEKTLTVTDEPGEEKLYTAAELLDITLAAYERGLADGYTGQRREHWRDPGTLASFRQARMRTETIEMKWRSDVRHTIYGYPDGYEYKGGAVDWLTGMPAGSACAWLRRQRIYALAAGSE